MEYKVCAKHRNDKFKKKATGQCTYCYIEVEKYRQKRECAKVFKDKFYHGHQMGQYFGQLEALLRDKKHPLHANAFLEHGKRFLIHQDIKAFDMMRWGNTSGAVAMYNHLYPEIVKLKKRIRELEN